MRYWKKNIISNGIHPNQRLQIYRNNYFQNLIEALQHIYPTIEKLVGNEFFVAIANEYIVNNAPSSSDLQQFGSHFGIFLKNFPTTVHLPYLFEVAQLEWAYHIAFHSEEIQYFDLHKLSSVSETDYEKIHFVLNPNAHLFSFQFPILKIWEFCNKEGIQQLELNEEGQKLLLSRRNFEIKIEELSLEEFIFLINIAEDNAFGIICDIFSLNNLNEEIDFLLQKHVKYGTIVDFYL